MSIGREGLTELPSQGPALGILPRFDWTARTIPFGPGDTLFLYTDGLTELRAPDGTFFGESRVLEHLRPGVAPKDLIGEIIETALPFCKGFLHDDLAMAALLRLV